MALTFSGRPFTFLASRRSGKQGSSLVRSDLSYQTELASPQSSFILITGPSGAPQSLERHLDAAAAATAAEEVPLLARLPQSAGIIVVCVLEGSAHTSHLRKTDVSLPSSLSDPPPVITVP